MEVVSQMASSDGKRQQSLFGPSLNPTSRLKAAMREAIRSGKYSREQIVDRMNEAARQEGLGGGRGSKISVAALDGWMAETKGNMIPVGLLPLFCWATESVEPLLVLAACLNATVITEAESKLLELARIDQETKRLARRRRILASEIE